MAVVTPEQALFSPWSDPALVLVDHQLKHVDKLRRDLATSGSAGEKAAICQRTRDDLLREHHSLGILFAVCRDVMKASEQSFDEPDERWKKFTDLANKGAKARARCIKALEVVASRWGRTLAHHYGWGAMGPGFCDQLRAAAREMDWPTFVRSLNPVLLDRHKSRTPEVAPIPALMNSITRPDIEKVRSQVQPGKVPCARLQRAEANDPEVQKRLATGQRTAKIESENRYRAADCLPAVLGLDHFGVIVRKKFDDPPKIAPSSTPSDPPPHMDSFLGLFHAEPAQPLPATLTNARSADRIPSLPPSPPSSPNPGTTTSLPTTGIYEHGPHRKRAASTHSDQSTKKQRADLPRLSAATDARRLCDVLAELQYQGSPLANKPQFAQFLKWAKEESEKNGSSHRDISTATPHHPHFAGTPSQTASATCHVAPSFLEQVLAPSPGSHGLDQSFQDVRSASRAPLTCFVPRLPNVHQFDAIDNHRRPAPLAEQILPPTSTTQAPSHSIQHACNNAALPTHRKQDGVTQSNAVDTRVVDCTERENITLRTGEVATSVSRSSNFDSNSFVLSEEQTRWALRNCSAQTFTLLLLQELIEQDPRLGSCVTFSIPKSIAQHLTTRPGELPDGEIPSFPGRIVEITLSMVDSALANGTLYMLNIPEKPEDGKPFITVWMTLDIAKEMVSASPPPT